MTGLETFARLVPAELWFRSGAVFYSGRAAFSRPSPIYLLGINPGGDPNEIVDQPKCSSSVWLTSPKRRFVECVQLAAVQARSLVAQQAAAVTPIWRCAAIVASS